MTAIAVRDAEELAGRPAPVIKAAGVTKRFGSKVALDGLDLVAETAVSIARDIVAQYRNTTNVRHCGNDLPFAASELTK
jgi:hypothetical protein